MLVSYLVVRGNLSVLISNAGRNILLLLGSPQILLRLGHLAGAEGGL